MVYISEAHASDEWKLGDIVSIEQHKTIEDRLQAANSFVSEYEWKIPTVVDSMDSVEFDSFERIYAAWPERYYVFKDNALEKLHRPNNEFGYDRLTLKRDLRQYISNFNEEQHSLLLSDFDLFNEEANCVQSDNYYSFEKNVEPFVPNSYA